MTPLPDDAALVSALRQSDEDAFALLVDAYHAGLVRLAQAYVPDYSAAEEVAQETWLGVIQGLDRFEGRSSLRTWIFRILVNTAKKRGANESRSVPFSRLEQAEDAADEPSVDPARFNPAGHQWAGGWTAPPQRWVGMDEMVSLRLTQEYLEKCITLLPPSQRIVITLHDMEGWTSEEVAEALGISIGNQRVLLHRARSRVRQALEDYMREQNR